MKKIKALLLAAGMGTRLYPFTDYWPKCLMPINQRPLMEYWLEILRTNGIEDVLVNMHYMSDTVKKFLNRPKYKDWVDSIVETKLLGTAGTLLKNSDYFKDCTILLIHADNWCQCEFENFLEFHSLHRPSKTSITMMTFYTDTPQTCGIVVKDKQGVIQANYEKEINPPGNIANGAVYLIESEVLEDLKKFTHLNDFSNEVLPKYIGKISTWHNHSIHRDIGNPKELLKAQLDPTPNYLKDSTDAWQQNFLKHPIHQLIQNVS